MAKRKLTTIKTIPFQGGCNTAVEPALLNGKPSMVQNFRQKHPGFVKRQGQIAQHSTADGTNKVLSMYQFVKGKKTERHFYAQFSDDDVLEATTAPPGVTTGVFGTEVFAGASSSLPASWANVNDLLIFANGVDTAQIYPGTASPVEKFIVYKGAAAIPTIPEIGDDYTLEVTDGDATTGAILDSLGDLAVDFDCIFVMTPVPIDTLNWTILKANATASASGANFWNGSAWTAVTSFNDTTDSGSATLAINGTMTWTLPTTHVPSYMYGMNGFWYQIYLASGDLDSETEVSAVTFESDWQAMQSIWDGITVPIIEAQLYDSVALTYKTYSSESIVLTGYKGGDILYIACTDPICGLLVDPGTPDGVLMQDISSISYWNGAWTAVTNLSDGSDGFSKRGWITFARQSDVQKQAFNSSVYYAYWYKITLPLTNAIACLNFNGDDAATTITDVSGKVWTVAGTAQLDTAQKKYGTASLLLDGNSDYISTPAHADFKFGTGDFTVEWWMRVDDLSANYYVIPLSIYLNSSNYFYILQLIDITTGLVDVDVAGLIAGAGDILHTTDSIGPVVADTWHHLAVVRKDGVIKVFFGGVPQTATTTTGQALTVFHDGATPYYCGRMNTTYATGWIDDLRIDNAALYSLSATFTPSAAEIGIGTGVVYPTGKSIGVESAPYFDIADFGKAQTVCSWKNRLSMSTIVDHYTYLSTEREPQSLNGDDAAILAPGDGRYNRPVAQRKLHDALIIWQEEKGQEGGCVTKYEWVTTVNDIKKTIISTTLGTMNAKSVDVVDGVEFAELNRDAPIMSLAYFISRYGVFVTDGSTCYMISQDIQNYFDPTNAVCIRVGYEKEHWLKYDSAYGVIRVGLVSGSSATVPNVFPVYDVKDKSWSFDVLQQPLSCMTEAEAGSGAVTVVQLGGGTADGTVYVLNSGLNDVSTAIDSFVTTEIDGNGEILNMSEMLLRAKVQSAGNITVTPSLNSIAQTAMTFAQTAEVANQTIRRHRVNTNLTGQHISLKVQHNTVSQSCQLLDMGTGLSAYEEQ